jgi:hypothetical protein
MSRDSKAGKKRLYSRPAIVELDASTAKAKLKAVGDPTDANVHRVSSLIDGQLSKQKTKAHSELRRPSEGP